MLRSKVENSDVSISEITRQNEILCSLDLSGNEAANAYKKSVAAELADVYKQGRKGVKSDKWKARKYARMGAVADKSYHIPNTLMRTKTVYNVFGWFNDFRLFSLRVNRVFQFIDKVNLGIIPTVLSAFGLFFILRLSFDISVVLKSVFRPEGEVEKTLSHWQRLKDVMNKENRRYRMLNDIVWFALNVTTFCILGPAAGMVVAKAFINISGFAFDTTMEATKWSETYAYNRALQNVKHTLSANKYYKEVHAKTQYLNQLKQFVNKHKKNKTQTKQVEMRINEIENEIKKIGELPEFQDSKKEYDKWTHIQTQLQKKTAEVKKTRLKTILLCAVICFGMSLSLFPFTLPLGVAVLGAVISFVGGSLLNGFVARLSDKFSAKKPVLKVTGVNKEVVSPNANKIFSRVPSAPKLDSKPSLTLKASLSSQNLSRSLSTRNQFFNRQKNDAVTVDAKIAEIPALTS